MRKVTNDKLWEMAQKRVAFRRHLLVYVLVNVLLVIMWYFTSYNRGNNDGYWFAYPLLGWGIGLAFHYWGAYHDDLDSVEKEYQKIREKYNNQGVEIEPDQRTDMNNNDIR